MAQEHNDEVDLVYVIKKIKETVKGWIVLLFKAIDYAIKFWVVLLVLLLIGLGLGYFAEFTASNNKFANIVLRVNFKSADYVYNTINHLNAKINQNDSTFLREKGFFGEAGGLREASIAPIPKVNDIIGNYETNNRNLEIIIENLEFEEGESSVNDLFTSDYKYHELKIKLTEKGTIKTVQAVLDYLNSDVLLNRLKDENITIITSTIQSNQKTLDQIDRIMDSYIIKENTPLQNNQVYIDQGLNFDRLLTSRAEILVANEKLRQDLVLSNSLVVPIGGIDVAFASKGLMSKKMLLYPIFFIFLFLFLAYAVYVFKYLKNIAEENNAQLRN